MVQRRSRFQMPLNIDQFLTISGRINYLLAPEHWDLPGILNTITDPFDFAEESPMLLNALELLQAGYQKKRRKLGPYSIIHPLRIVSILSRVMGYTNKPPSQWDILLALLHDKDEDLIASKISEKSFLAMNQKWAKLRQGLTPRDLANVDRCLALLTQKKDQNYYSYLGELVKNSPEFPELLHVKLADRIDNTLDTHMQEGIPLRYDFYRIIVDKLLAPVDVNTHFKTVSDLSDPKFGALRLQQFYKNIIFLTLLRRSSLDRLDPSIQLLFETLAEVSILEANMLILNIFSHQILERQEQIQIIVETINYSQQGGIVKVTSDKDAIDEDLDGALKMIFSIAMEKGDKDLLKKLFDRPKKLAKIMFAFIGVFTAFIQDAHFYLEGISEDGIKYVDD